MLETLDAAAVRRWCAAGLAALRRHQVEIDRLNVFPVPDGDTGTNLVLTLGSAHEALRALGAAEGRAPGTAAEALRSMARGALYGARGNSGVILSQLLKGIAEALAGEALAGEALAGEALAGEALAGEAPAGEARAGEALAEGARAGEALAGERAAG
ncbi:DAK2 domain-containing protein, partial [Rhizomonospora bruguierae]|uniref:DAK2 domain-containing protein n=1 Tax=Rhizomonospora bruguierae TaxID=1581705 RepID=UPI001BCAD966